MANEGTYIVKGPARIKLENCKAEVMGSDCNGCEAVIPIGRVFIIKVKNNGCKYSLTPSNAVLEYSRVGETLYKIKERVITRFLEGGYNGVLFIGPPDRGKSTLSILVHNTLKARLKGKPVALVTTDIGQNELYAPCFVSASSDIVLPGVPSRLLENCFVGSTSPPQSVERYFLCINRIVKKLLEKGYKIVVDTDGWISGMRGVYSKLAVISLLRDPLIISSPLPDRDRRVIEYFYPSNIMYYEIEGLKPKRRDERRLHRVRLIAKELRGASHIVIRGNDVKIVGLPVFNGEALDLKTLGWRDAVYAEKSEDGVTLVLRKGRKTLERGAGINILVEGWEKGLIASLYLKSEVKGLGVVESIDYKRKRVTLISSYRGPVDMVEIGVSKFPELVDQSNLHGAS